MSDGAVLVDVVSSDVKSPPPPELSQENTIAVAAAHRRNRRTRDRIVLTG
jgi:hypothetical protein